MSQTIPAAGTFEYARTCYHHMAGWFGVALTDAMVRKRILVPQDGKRYIVTPYGIRWFQSSFGIVVPAVTFNRQRIAVQCLDGTVRRPHLAGWLGRALCRHFLEQKWVVPIAGTRALNITVEGKRHVQELMHMTIAQRDLCSN